jgi:hypothetical protein
LNLLNEMAPTAFDKARLLLLSQCDPCKHDSFIPLESPDRGPIAVAIHMLRTEKNGKAGEANELLRQLKNIEGYREFLGDWQG